MLLSILQSTGQPPNSYKAQNNKGLKLGNLGRRDHFFGGARPSHIKGLSACFQGADARKNYKFTVVNSTPPATSCGLGKQNTLIFIPYFS